MIVVMPCFANWLDCLESAVLVSSSTELEAFREVDVALPTNHPASTADACP
jgi:hypothetical protein